MRNDIPALTSNLTVANRPTDVPIRYIVVHATQLSYDETVARFQAPNQVSAHLVLRASDGLRTEMVAPENIAWHAGNWDINCRSLGIEQEAFVEQPDSFTPTMLSALAQQIKEWAAKFNIPLDRAHILGHDNVPSPSKQAILQMHQDPGWYFNWQRLFELLGQPLKYTSQASVGDALQIVAQFVDLYRAPNTTSGLIGLAEGPTLSHRASYGEEFVCVAKHGEWLAIIFDGQLAWLNNAEKVATGVNRSLYTVAAKGEQLLGSTQSGAKPIADLLGGQQFVISDRLTGLETSENGGQFVAKTSTDAFIQVWYNHRIGFIKISD